MAKKFENDETGFTEWRDGNPDGFICNIPKPNARNEREYRLKYICLHKARCRTIARNKNNEQTWTTNGYFKLCAETVQPIADWIERNADLPVGWELRRCSKCAP